MVLIYDYSNQNRRRWRTNAPPSRAISMATICQCTGAIWSASHNAAWPGLHQKPLDSAIGWLLALYCPGSRQGNNQQNDNAECTHFACRFDGHWDAAVGYYAHHLMEEVRPNRTRQRRLFWTFHREKGLELTCWPLITIGVCHIKLMRRT